MSDKDGDGLADAGEMVTYTFRVTNTGDVTLADIAVDDPKVGQVTCPSASLEPGSAVTCSSAPYAVTDDDVASGKVHNVATASGSPVNSDGPVKSPPSSVSLPVDDEDGGNGAGGGQALAYSGAGALGEAVGWAVLRRWKLFFGRVDHPIGIDHFK